jgi:chorismate mutase/prephenate dehydratase
MLRVAFQGELGAFSEQAANAYFSTRAITPCPYKTLKRTFESVENRTVDYGIVPAENSLEGTVNETYDLLLESSLRICGECKLRIDHCLMALPSTQIQQLRVVYSHPQALAQCSRFLETLHVRIEPTYDTAGSAKLITDSKLENAAAIASPKAAQIYGLNILEKRIANLEDNFTRFYVIGQEDTAPTGFDKTTVVFATKHTPGSLYRALRELAIRQINLTKIESRPMRTTPWEYRFFVEFEGHQKDTNAAEAIDALRKSTTFLKVLGSYAQATN